MPDPDSMSGTPHAIDRSMEIIEFLWRALNIVWST
jgi:hypothetical protein